MVTRIVWVEPSSISGGCLAKIKNTLLYEIHPVSGTIPGKEAVSIFSLASGTTHSTSIACFRHYSVLRNGSIFDRKDIIKRFL